MITAAVTMNDVLAKRAELIGPGGFFELEEKDLAPASNYHKIKKIEKQMEKFVAIFVPISIFKSVDISSINIILIVFRFHRFHFCIR